MNKSILLLLFLAIGLGSKAQEASLRDYKKALNARAVLLDSTSNVVLAQDRKSRKWGMYDVYMGMTPEDIYVDQIIPPSFDSLAFFSFGDRFIIVKNKGKYGLLLLPGEIQDAHERTQCIYDELRHVRRGDQDYVLYREGNRWGLIDWFEEFVIIEPLFAHPNEVPLITLNSWEVDLANTAKELLNADIVKFDPINGDGAFQARHRITGKWGMFQSGGSAIDTMIPMVYDSIHWFGWNAYYTAVFSGGQLGIYTSKWSLGDQAGQSVPTQYEDYQKFSADGVPKLALKRDGKWGWVNWLTGEEMSSFKAETPDDLGYPYYHQALYPED